MTTWHLYAASTSFLEPCAVVRARLFCFVCRFKECSVSLRVENTGPQSVFFIYYTPLSWLRNMTLEDEHKVTKANPLCLKSGITQSFQMCAGRQCKDLASESKTVNAPSPSPSPSQVTAMRFRFY